MSLIEDFLKAIDARWERAESRSERKVRLRIIGSGALLLQTSYERGTKDSDVLETADLLVETKKRLIALAGPDTVLATQHRLYLDIVPNGLPFLPHPPLYHSQEKLNASLFSFEVDVLDVVDVVVSKLKRFNANDRSDIDAMIQTGLVDHVRLIERFRSAADLRSGAADAEDLPRWVKNLHRVERDFFDVDETDIELPDWI